MPRRCESNLRENQLLRRTVAAVALLFLMTAPVFAGKTTPELQTPSSQNITGLLDASNVVAFTDSALSKAMNQDGVPGAVISIVQGRHILMEKGYGLADVKANEPVSAQDTLFRVASISKILTAASVLQLSDAGKLSLHRNVNDYLSRLVIASAFNKPLTLHDLLTHSSGFDVCRFHYGARTPSQKYSLLDYLIRCQPARIRPPGLFSSYDNYGYSLAGYLVQQVSRIPFGEYVRERIFEPLGMDQSTFAPQGAMRENLALGYRRVRGNLRPYQKDFVNIKPAAGLCTTAADMTKLLIALCRKGNAAGTGVFSRDVIRGLEQVQFKSDPQVPGRCYGFNRIILSGRQALRQTGQWPGFNSVLLLLPGQNLGLFLAYNLSDDLHMGKQIARSFVERFTPKAKPESEQAAVHTDQLPPLSRFSGRYASVRFPVEAPHLASPREINVQVLAEDKLGIDGEAYQEAKPGVFERIAEKGAPTPALGKWVAFREDAEGRVRHLITQSGALRRISWLESKAAASLQTRATSCIMISAVFFWLTAGLIRSMRRRTSDSATSMSGDQPRRILPILAKALAVTTCLIILGMQIIMAVEIATIDPFASFYGIPAPLRLVLRCAPAIGALSITLLILSVWVWRRGFWQRSDRFVFTCVTIFSLLYCGRLQANHLWSDQGWAARSVGDAVHPVADQP